MFEDWKKAWDQAVANFERELNGEDPPPHLAGRRASSMERDLNAARRALDRLEADLIAARKELAVDEEQAQTNERRGAMAENIGDEETARIARDFARRHAGRAAILRRKVEVLQDELTLRREDLEVMEAQAAAELEEIEAAEQNRTQAEADFRRLEQDRREREADARLEELKKRMK